MLNKLIDLVFILENARDAHQSVARSCGSLYDLNGDFYHSGIAAGYSEVVDYLRSLLSELDSESGRKGYVYSAR